MKSAEYYKIYVAVNLEKGRIFINFNSTPPKFTIKKIPCATIINVCVISKFPDDGRGISEGKSVQLLFKEKKTKYANNTKDDSVITNNIYLTFR